MNRIIKDFPQKWRGLFFWAMRWRFFSGKFAYVREAPKYTPPHHFLLFPRCLSVYLPYSILGRPFFFLPVWGQNTVAYFPSPHNILPHFCNIPPLLISFRTVKKKQENKFPLFSAPLVCTTNVANLLFEVFLFTGVHCASRFETGVLRVRSIDSPFLKQKSDLIRSPRVTPTMEIYIYRATDALLFPTKKVLEKDLFFFFYWARFVTKKQYQRRSTLR